MTFLAKLLEEDNTINLNLFKENREIARFEVRSRHTKCKTCKCYVHFDSNNTGIGEMKQYCCSYANGIRTLDCCGHIAANIYSLSYAKYRAVNISACARSYVSVSQ